MTDLAGTQLSNLLETLPGIAKVLRSPVADAIVSSGQGGLGPRSRSIQPTWTS